MIGHSLNALADVRNQSSPDNSIDLQSGNALDVANYTGNDPTSTLSSSDMGQQVETVDWCLVAKGIALSMGQGIVSYIPDVFSQTNSVYQFHYSVLLSHSLIHSLRNRSHGGIFGY